MKRTGSVCGELQENKKNLKICFPITHFFSPPSRPFRVSVALGYEMLKQSFIDLSFKIIYKHCCLFRSGWIRSILMAFCGLKHSVIGGISMSRPVIFFKLFLGLFGMSSYVAWFTLALDNVLVKFHSDDVRLRHLKHRL